MGASREMPGAQGVLQPLKDSLHGCQTPLDVAWLLQPDWHAPQPHLNSALAISDRITTLGVARQHGMGMTGVLLERRGDLQLLRTFLHGCQTSLKSSWLLLLQSCAGVPPCCQSCIPSWCCTCWLLCSPRSARVSGAGSCQPVLQVITSLEQTMYACLESMLSSC